MKKRILYSLLAVILMTLLVLPMTACRDFKITPEIRAEITKATAKMVGPAGPQGPTGVDGADGVDGLPGADGKDGAPGYDGVDGEDGADGIDGTDGDVGAQGIQGLAGYGYPGPTGATGPAGAIGVQGDAGPAFLGLGFLLYIEDGTQEIAHVTYVLDTPIALGDLVELPFFQELVYGAGGFGANVVLGIDVDGDGYEADDLAWHIGENTWNPTVLGDDTFIEMDGTPFSVVRVDALSVNQWWTPNAAGDGFGGPTPWGYYGSYQGLLDPANQENTRLTSESTVCLIRLVIGGSGSWMDIAVRVTSTEMVPSKVGVYSE